MNTNLSAEKFHEEIQFDPALKEILLMETGHHLGASSEAGTGTMIPVVARLKSGAEAIPGLQIITRMGPIVTGRVAIGNIVSLRQHPAIASLKASSGFTSDLSNSLKEIGASQENFRQAGIPILPSKHIKIGFIDWGVDFAHEAFLDKDGQTRLQCIWDQRGGPNAESPQPYGYGTVYTQTAINRALQRHDPYRALGYDPAQIDTRGEGTHGTHVMSIAAGSGRIPGVAPDAALIFVHLKGNDTRPEDTLGDSVRLLEAVDFILKQAGDDPIVINLSLGRTGDAKDGSSPVEQALDAALNEKPGRVICMSTGNYYNARLHGCGHLHEDESHALRWWLPRHRQGAAEMEIWYSGHDSFDLRLFDPNSALVGSAGLGETTIVRNEKNRVVASIYSRARDPNNGENLINIHLHEPAASGQWCVVLTAKESHSGDYDVYIERTQARSQSRLHPDDTDPRSTIGTISSGHATIACGAYHADDPLRRLGAYSSAGPTRDRRQVPVLSAPGEAIMAARSSSPDVLGFRRRNGYIQKSGTSMAAPHCSGVAALIMASALPHKLSAAEVREILITTARPAPYHHPDDPLRYGAGLLNATAAITLTMERYGAPQAQGPLQDEHMNKEESIMTNHNLDSIVEDLLPLENYTGDEESEHQSALEWLTVEPALESASTVSEFATPTLVRDHVTMEWQDLNYVTGGDGRRHVYYLTTGDPDRGRATFKIQLRNTTRRRLRNVTIKWRLSRRVNGTWHTVPLAGQKEGKAYFADRAPNLSRNSATTRSMLVSNGILERAYNDRSPLCRMEVEYHWFEERTPYYNRHGLTFYLFRPIEFLFQSTGRPDGSVAFNQSAHRRNGFWLRIRGKHFREHDRQPVNITSTISTNLVRTTSEQRSAGARMTSTSSVTRGLSTTIGSETGTSLSVGIEKIIEAGVSSKMSASQSTSIQWSRSRAQEFSRQIVHSETFTQGYTRTQTVNWVLQASNPGTVRTLYAYPVFDRVLVRVVIFGSANRFGQATQRSVIDNFPVLIFSHWVDISIVTPANNQESAYVDETEVPLIGEDTLSEVSLLDETLQSIPRLRPNQVTHLAFEGGGGKGVIYLGAIKAMEALNILRYRDGRLASIRGISGSSAGAITALALSLGINHQGLMRMFRGPRRIQFNQFFDMPAEPRKTPRINRGCANASRSSVVDRYLFNVIQQLIRSGLDTIIPDLAQRLSASLSPDQLSQRLVRYLRQELHRQMVDSRLRDQDAEAKLLSKSLLYYLINLVEDLGFFSGCHARNFIDSLIAQRAGGQRNLTFAQHQARFHVKLVISGSNLETGKTEYFSADTTPNMAVADAVRISMSLPIIYKPVRISRSESRIITRRDASFSGLWVDGGLWNNLPLRAFGQPGPNNGTLGIRLGVPERVSVNNFVDFLKRYLVDFGVMGSGEASQSRSSGLLSRVITLDIGDLDTTDFDPPPQVADPLIAGAEVLTRRYFRA